MNYQMSWDGTVLYEDGTAIKPDGSIMTPGGTVVNPDYSMTLTNGDTIPAATVMPDGSTAGFNLDAVIKTGLSLTQAALQVLGKLGVAATPPRTVMSSGQISPASTGWVNQTQYRTPTGQLVQPQQLANGLYQLPDGSVVGGPAPSMFGMSQNTLLIAGGLGVAALLLMRSGVSPFGIHHRCSPVFMSIAVILPYGGLSSGRPISAGRPPPPLAMNGDTLSIALNGIEIFQRAIEPNNSRCFGLYHSQSVETRVRKALLTGPWPEMLSDEIRNDLLALASPLSVKERQFASRLLDDDFAPGRAADIVIAARALDHAAVNAD